LFLISDSRDLHGASKAPGQGKR